MASESIGMQEWADLAESRSRVYGFLGGLYNRLPDEAFMAGLLSPELADFLRNMDEKDDMGDDMHDGISHIDVFIHAHRDDPLDELTTRIGVERTRLLRGVNPGYGPQPPYESMYANVRGTMNAGVLASIIQIYAEAGVVVPEDARDQPDYIGMELDFLRHLCMKESEAWAAGDAAAAAGLLEQERGFLTGHAARWMPDFCDAMYEDAKLDLYLGVARLTKGFVLDEAARIEEYLDLARTAATND